MSEQKKIMIILRGPPGTGKSTKGKKILDFFKEQGITGVQLSTDDYFVVNDEYVFVPSLIKKAHEWNYWRAEKYVTSKLPLILIDNTNIKLWEMEKYIKLAEAKGYDVFQYVCKGDYKSVHGVPEDVVQRMKDSFEESDLPHWSKE